MLINFSCVLRAKTHKKYETDAKESEEKTCLLERVTGAY